MSDLNVTSRLNETSMFRNEGGTRWRKAKVSVFGGGNLGSRFCLEAVRSGVSIWACDPDVGELANLETQLVHQGEYKVRSIVEQCEQIRPGLASGEVADVRHVGVGVLRRSDLLVDCTDDPRLALFLTEVSNGLRIPLLRLAVDGTGQREMGRVLCSDGGNGHACQICSYSVDDLWRPLSPTPCPGGTFAGRPPTRAGGALGMTIAGVGLLQAQRLITGNDLDSVQNREVIIDWSSMHVFAGRLPRSADCLSGHVQWDIIDVPGSDVTSIADVFKVATNLVGSSDVTLEAFGHALCLEASCRCGHRQVSVGTRWASAPSCPECGELMLREEALQVPMLDRCRIDALGIADNTLAQLGFAETGGLYIARTSSQPSVRFVID